MSLDDKFFPEDGTLLTKYDNFMIKKAGKVGDIYQKFTENSYEDLVDKTKIFGINGGYASIFGAPFTYMDFQNQVEKLSKIETPLEESIKYETISKNSSLGKEMRLNHTILGSLVSGLGVLVGTGDDYRQLGVGFSIWGASILISNFAEYLSKSNLPKPPKKTISQLSKTQFQN